MMKSLVVYFSHCHENYVDGQIISLKKGNTKIVAETIHQMLESDLFEIEPLHEYPINYKECTILAKKELQTQARPKIKNIIPFFEQYENIYLGFPNWWGTMPMCVWTFLESYDFDEKNIYPFITHEGGGFSKSLQDLKKLVPKAYVHDGLDILGHQVNECHEQIKNWVDERNENK